MAGGIPTAMVIQKHNAAATIRQLRRCIRNAVRGLRCPTVNANIARITESSSGCSNQIPPCCLKVLVCSTACCIEALAIIICSNVFSPACSEGIERY